MNDHLLETKPRNIIKAIFISEIERHPSSDEILTKDFVEFNFPPFVEFIKNYNKNHRYQEKNFNTNKRENKLKQIIVKNSSSYYL